MRKVRYAVAAFGIAAVLGTGSASAHVPPEPDYAMARFLNAHERYVQSLLTPDCEVLRVFEDGSATAICANGEAFSYDPEDAAWEIVP
jgi:hypothetical protein